MNQKDKYSDHKSKVETAVIFWTSLLVPGGGFIILNLFPAGFSILFLEFVLMTIPATMLLFSSNISPSLVFVLSIVSLLFIHIVSIIIPLKRQTFKLADSLSGQIKKIVSGIFSILLIVFGVMVFFTIFNISIVKDNLMNPNLLSGDICLSFLAEKQDIDIGDIVKSKDSFLRVVSNRENICEIKSGQIYLNGRQLKYDVPKHNDAEIFPQLLYYEINGEVKYRIYVDIESDYTAKFYYKKNNSENSLFLVNDNRKIYYPKIDKSQFYYKLDRVIFRSKAFTFFKSLAAEKLEK